MKMSSLAILVAFILGASCLPSHAAQPCSEDAKLMAKWSGAMQAAQQSGDSCRMTDILIKVLEATRAALPHCSVGAALRHDQVLLDQRIAQAKESFAGHCN